MRFRPALLALVFVVGTFVLPAAAHAGGIPFFDPIIPQTGDQAVCPASWGMLITVINNLISFLLTLAIVFVAPLAIAWAGFLFVVNPVNAGGKEQAKKILLNTVVGIVIALAGWIIVDAIMAALYHPSDAGKTWVQLITGNPSDVCLPQQGALPGETLNQAGVITPSSPGLEVGTSGVNVSSAVQYLDSKAKASPPYGQCALYVRQALSAGGLTSLDRLHPANAYEYGPTLTNLGFSTVSASGYAPQAGDVIIFQPVAGHSAGHIEMYNGSQWVSDFKQNSMLPSTDYQGGSYAIYRA